MDSNFLLLDKTYRTIDFINKMIANFPKQQFVIKNYLERVLYEMVENLFAFNINDSKRIREKFLKDYIVKLSMVNYLLHQSLKKQCITYKQSEKVAEILLDLKKISMTILKGLGEESSDNV